MRAALNALLLLRARSTDRALIHHVQYLTAENQILRSELPRIVPVTPPERRRLVRLGKPLGLALSELISIASPRTFLRWQHAEGRPSGRRAGPLRPGRPRTPEAVRELVVRLARENAWGSTRILGELKKLACEGSAAQRWSTYCARRVGPRSAARRGQLGRLPDSWSG